MTSKGQVTVPLQIRRKLGLKRGDRVEFHERGAETLISRAAERENPFDKFIGILRGKRKRLPNAKQWMAKLRDED